MTTVHQMGVGQVMDEKSEIDSVFDERVQGQSIWSMRLRPNGHGIVKVGLSKISKE